jgi:hypothetical protein
VKLVKKDHKVSLDHKEIKEDLDLKVLKVFKVHRENLDLKDQ